MASSAGLSTTAGARRGWPRAAASLERLDGPLGMALLFAVAVAYSVLTILKGLQPNDEGLMLQAAARIAGGEVPYKDFWWFYPPGQPYLLAGLWKLFGPSLLTWRILRVLTNGAVALIAYRLARRQAGAGLALVAWGIATVAMAVPTGPHPYPIALALALAALLVLDRSPVLAGVLLGACAAWRIEFAGYLTLGALCGYAIRAGAGRLRAALELLAAAAVTAALLFGPVVIAAGLGRSWDLLIRYPVEDFGKYQSLPFPLHFGGSIDLSSASTARDTLSAFLTFYLPLVLVVGLAACIVALLLSAGRAQWQHFALAVFGVGMVHYLITRPDPFHTGPLAVTLGVLAAWTLALVRRPRPGPLLARLEAVRRLAPLRLVPAAAVCLVLAWIVIDGVQRTERQVEVHTVRVSLDVADGVRQLPRYTCSLPGAPVQVCTLSDLEHAVRYVRSHVPSGRPIYVATERSDLVTSGAPILYVLAERRSATPYDIAAPGVVTSARVQRIIVRDLARERPLVVRWTASITAAPEPNRAGRSTGVHILDDYLRARYRRSATFGSYVVLVPRP
jgi:hypothetical protein